MVIWTFFQSATKEYPIYKFRNPVGDEVVKFLSLIAAYPTMIPMNQTILSY